jgi:hypothetical protein
LKRFDRAARNNIRAWPLMVALSRPFPDGTNERSAKRQGRSLVTPTSAHTQRLDHRQLTMENAIKHIS